MVVDDVVLTDYGLGTLPEEQVAEIERFLRSHPEAAARVRTVQDEMAELVLSLPAETVSPASEDALVDRLRHRGERPPRPREVPVAAPKRSPRWAALGLAAALGTAAWLALGPLSNSGRLERETARYQAQPGAVSSRLVTREDEEIGTMVRLPDGRLFVAFERRPPEGVYQLWVIRDGEAESLAVVGGRSLLTEPVADGGVFGVTLEPPGGSDQPTGEPLVLFSI